MAKCHHLYDFPLDIIKTLLDNVLETIGIAETARLRLVCTDQTQELFDREIPGALYRSPDFKTPNSRWTPSHDRVVEEYILHRTLADGRRKQNLSARLHRILESILPEERSDNESYRTALQQLVSAIVRQSYSCDAYLQLMHPLRDKTLPVKTFNSDRLKAAAALGITHIFDDIVADACLDGRESTIHDPDAAFNRSSLVFASMGGHLSLVTRILDSREAATRGTKFDDIDSALRVAILGGHVPIIRLLLEPKHGYLGDCLHLSSLAASVNRIDVFYIICELIRTPLDDLRNLTEAARHGHIDFVKLCLANGANVNGNAVPISEMYEQESPLQAASARGYRKIVQLLLENGANPTDYLGSQQSLTEAARFGHHEIVADLLAAGAIPAHCQSWSPLISACRNGHVRVAEALLDSGIELWYKDQALCIAACGRYETLVRLLVSRGAGIDGYAGSPFDDDNPPILGAMIRGHDNVVMVLQELGAKDPIPLESS
ncbi:ankyrin repeat-containing domain protein [Cadophora sp. MPI-SDFR-AT-0126]|nr:ankyrin repeat-containing domain protein [Leotiomycetes sp. MPI-SDFR-AT-0126]